MASASDNFNRANENPLAGNWETVHNALQIVSNVVNGAVNGAECSASYKASTTTFSADHYSEVVVVNAAIFDLPGVGVRCTTASGGNGYFLTWEQDNNRFQWKKLVAGVYSNFGSTIAYTLANGDTIRASVTTNAGTADLKAYANGVQKGSTQNDASSVLTSGQPGLYYFRGNVNATTLDNWAAADLGGTAYTLTADMGSFTLTGEPAARDLAVTAAQGSFALTGNAATLTRAARITAALGSFGLTGFAATLFWSGIPPASQPLPERQSGGGFHRKKGGLPPLKRINDILSTAAFKGK